MMGPPGAGKGTQSKIVCNRLGIIQISTGDILRDSVKKETILGVKAKKFMDAGNLVSDEIVIGIIEERIQEDDCKGGFILDGFPRTTDQAKALDDILTKFGRKVDHVINFEVQNEALVERLLQRAKKEGRADDNIESISNRLKIFNEQTQPLINYYTKNGISNAVAGEGDIEEISNRVKNVIKA